MSKWPDATTLCGCWLWATSIHEARWHVVDASSATWSLEAVCGHLLHGPMHRRKTYPGDEMRGTCAGCLHTFRGFRPCDGCRADGEPVWPTEDPCAETPTVLMIGLRDALEFLESRHHERDRTSWDLAR